MKLLITTQILDSRDSNLGFFHRWIEEFARNCEKVTVICLYRGEYMLPENVEVLTLGKESGSLKLVRLYRFFNYIFMYRHEYDAVFVHMNPEYVVLGGYFWRKWGKKIGLWYAHKSVTTKLKKAVKIVDTIFTSSESGFRVETPKKCVVGQGIDTELFRPEFHLESTGTRFVTTGRIAESKHLIEILRMLDVLYEQHEKFTFTIVGIPTNRAEHEYARRLDIEISRRPYSESIQRIGAVTHRLLPAILHSHDIFLNFSTTGSLDKAVLESLATGTVVLSANEAFQNLLDPYGLYIKNLQPQDAASVLQKFLNRPDRSAIIATLRNKIVAEHSLSKLIPKILSKYSELQND